LLNLIVNASRYSPEETAIRVQLEREPGRIVFSIADSGPGIPSDLRTKIFERFFRVDKDRSRSQGGTGLGRSIVRQISRLHGGRVWVEANPAGGSVFRVSLPL
ncbi:MAG: ATP-binding protein, partial [Leptospiraceae bacterium]|nr:ATP-binding protein [Leptospiraceae bacterium]